MMSERASKGNAAKTPPYSANIPMRACIGCRARAEKSRLIRIARSKEGFPYLDADGKGGGRGTYLCPKRECVQRGLTEKNLRRALRLDARSDLGVEGPAELFERLRKEALEELERWTA